MVFDFDGTLADVCIDFDHMREKSILTAMAVAGELLPLCPPFSSADGNAATAATLTSSTRTQGSHGIQTRRGANDTDVTKDTVIPDEKPLPHSSTIDAPPQNPAGGIHDTGQPVLEWLAVAYAHVAQTDEGIAQAMHDAVHRTIIEVEVEAARRSTLFNWTRPLLKTLRKQDIATLVITRNCRQAVETVFPDIISLTDAVLTRDDVARVKPHPEHLLKALQLAGVAAEHAIMVGDHPMDIVTGKAAGTMTAGVTSGHASAAALSAESPDYLTENGYTLYSALHSRFWPHTDRLILPPAA